VREVAFLKGITMQARCTDFRFIFSFPFHDSYLSGAKCYRAVGELGFETLTLDMEGNVTRRESYDHVTQTDLENVLPQFVGKIQQVPPIYSAIRQSGTKLYEKARAGELAEDIEIEARQVEIVRLELLDAKLPRFDIEVECGGGTYIRSLVRDIGHKVNSVATTIRLERTTQGPFVLDDCLKKDDWNADNIYAAIDRFNIQ